MLSNETEGRAGGRLESALISLLQLIGGEGGWDGIGLQGPHGI